MLSASKQQDGHYKDSLVQAWRYSLLDQLSLSYTLFCLPDLTLVATLYSFRLFHISLPGTPVRHDSLHRHKIPIFET